jgi:hypothetical protein
LLLGALVAPLARGASPAWPREGDVRRFNDGDFVAAAAAAAEGPELSSAPDGELRRVTVLRRPASRWTESPATLDNASMLDWQFTVPESIALARVKLTRGEEEIHGLDVLYRVVRDADAPKAESARGDFAPTVGVSVWPLPPETPAEKVQLSQARATIESVALAPGMPALRDAGELLDFGVLKTADVKAGGPVAARGEKRRDAGVRFYAEYDAPYVAISAVPVNGALYVAHAAAPGGSRRESERLREIVDSFRVGDFET